MASHMPAWKRLGLKLKYANDDNPTNAIKSQRDQILASTEARYRPSELSQRPAKRQRLDDPARTNKTSTPEQAHARSDQRPPAQRNGVQSARTEGLPASSKQSTKRRKSVMFTDDTKFEDGDSRITIDFPAGSPGQTPKKAKILDVDVVQTDTMGSPSPVTAADGGAPPKKRSKAKTGKISKRKQRQIEDKSSPALEYLHQHRYDRDSWKFNKNREVWILKRALNSDTIPNSHALPLAGYVRGLPQQAASRTRLVKECREALVEARLESDGNEQDRIRLNDILSNTKSNETETDLFLQHHSRPAVLLWALGERTDSSIGGTSGNPSTSQMQPEPPKKTKKSRTSAPIDISSSSESESESDSAESSRYSELDTRSKTRMNGMGIKTNETTMGADAISSSGGASTSSEDDNDSTSSSGSSSSDD